MKKNRFVRRMLEWKTCWSRISNYLITRLFVWFSSNSKGFVRVFLCSLNYALSMDWMELGVIYYRRTILHIFSKLLHNKWLNPYKKHTKKKENTKWELLQKPKVDYLEFDSFVECSKPNCIITKRCSRFGFVSISH